MGKMGKQRSTKEKPGIASKKKDWQGMTSKEQRKNG